MSLFRKSLPAALALAGLAAPARHVAAQAASADPHHVALGVALGAGTIPDAFSSRCGRENTGSLGWGAQFSALARPRRVLVVQADARATFQTLSTGCTADLPLRQLAPNVYETRPGADFPGGTPHVPMASTTVRVGLETPRSLPLVRLSAGGGAVLGQRVLPVGIAALGMGTRGRGKRIYGEVEYSISRTSASERRDVWTYPPGGTRGPIVEPHTVPLVEHPHWTTVHLGVEIPFANR